MLHAVSEREFMELMRDKERYVEERHMDAAHLYASLAEHWASRIAPVRIVILMYIASCTLLRGRSAARIPLSDIERAVNVSESSIRRHVKGLTDEGFMHVYHTTAGNEGHEKEPRMFEVDCNFVLKPSEFAVDAPPKLLKIPAISRENALKSTGVSNWKGGVSNWNPPTYINTLSNVVATHTDNSRTKVLPSARSSRAVADQGVKMPVHFPEPKKPRATATKERSLAEIVSSVTAIHENRRADRARSAVAKSPHKLSVAEFQALADVAQKDAGLQHRLVVTGKEFGLLRKRFADSPPSDMQEFISYVLRYWTTISQQHRAAVRKSETRKATGERAIPAHPDFTSLAYRYPYFLKCFANFKAERTIQAKESTRDTEEQLRETIRKQSEEIRSMRFAARTRTARPSPAAPAAPAAEPVAVVARRTRRVAEDFGGDDLPEWTTPTTRRTRSA